MSWRIRGVCSKILIALTSGVQSRKLLCVSIWDSPRLLLACKTQQLLLSWSSFKGQLSHGYNKTILSWRAAGNPGIAVSCFFFSKRRQDLLNLYSFHLVKATVDLLPRRCFKFGLFILHSLGILIIVYNN